MWSSFTISGTYLLPSLRRVYLMCNTYSGTCVLFVFSFHFHFRFHIESLSSLFSPSLAVPSSMNWKSGGSTVITRRDARRDVEAVPPPPPPEEVFPGPCRICQRRPSSLRLPTPRQVQHVAGHEMKPQGRAFASALCDDDEDAVAVPSPPPKMELMAHVTWVQLY